MVLGYWGTYTIVFTRVRSFIWTPALKCFYLITFSNMYGVLSIKVNLREWMKVKIIEVLIV